MGIKKIKLLSAFFTIFLTLQVSDVVADCTSVDFMTCTTKLANALQGAVDKPLTEQCQIIRDNNKCFDDLAKECNDTAKNASLVTKAISETLNEICKDDATIAKMSKIGECVRSKINDISKCYVAPSNPKPTVKDTCKSVKGALSCYPGAMEKACGKEAKDVTDKLINIWNPSVKSVCGGTSAVTGFFALILMGLFIVFKFNPKI